MTDEPQARIDWLASYPKSGNTWMRMLLANYFSEKDAPHDINGPGVVNRMVASRAMFDEVTGIASADLTPEEADSLMPVMLGLLVAEAKEPIWLKVHDALWRLPDGRWRLPPAVSGVAVYILRNPLDVAVSIAFHDAIGIEASVRGLCDPAAAMPGTATVHLRQRLGDWSQHVESWVDQTEIPVLAVRYEDMLANPARELERVIRFARPEVPIQPSRLAKAVSAASFDKLRDMEREGGFRARNVRQNAFFRGGRAGDWRNHLTDDQARRIREHHFRMMRRFGYD